MKQTKEKKVWTLYCGEPTPARIVRASKRPGKVVLETVHGPAHVPVEHEEYTKDLYPSEARARRAYRASAIKDARRQVRAELQHVQYVKRQATSSAKYLASEVRKAAAKLGVARRNVVKAGRL